jgi:two-component system, sensor histidine kinase
VDDLLDVARVVTGKVVLRPEPLELARLVERALAAVTATHRTDDRTITVQAEPVVVYADATRLEQVVTNLVVNALKYTPPGGEIAIAVQRDGAEAVLTVRDSGVGIAPDLLPRIFDLFVQGERSLQRTAGGLGVGLTLVRRLVELHGGRVTAASDGDGRGSTFTVRLPARREAERGDPSPMRAATPRRVLIVEDNDDAREMLRELLRLLGHEVYETGDGASGVARALELQPDLTLVDVGLPEMDGYEVARRIRSDPAGARLYLAALTGYGRPEDRERALAAGYDVHLVKPIDQGKLERLLVPLGGG